MVPHPISVLLLTIAIVLAYLKGRNGGKRLLPPGPRPIPFLGNVIGIDTRSPWKTYTAWAAEYGPIFYTQLLGQDIIVINSERVAHDLLDRRSHNYSSRPTSIYRINQLFGTEFSSIFLPYGDRWRLHRRLFHQAFNRNAATAFRPTQMKKAHELIINLMNTPDDFMTHLETLGNSLIMVTVYGYEPSSRNDPIVTQVKTAVDIAVKEVKPAVAALLSVFPYLEYIPPWFPGGRLNRSALISQRSIVHWVDGPFQYVMKSMAAGTASPSVLSDILTRIQQTTETEDTARVKKAAKEACASAYAAASETTSTTLSIFILAMVLYPEVQKRAQAEIDSVLGLNPVRLPVWEDRSSLPYIDAVIKETLRWHPGAPLGIPHATVNDDVYEGYFIPKGATILVNAWAMSRDTLNYPEPDEFLPERFLASDKVTETPLDPSFVFGFGRRVCVGRYVADASLWAAIVNMLTLFSFEPVPGWNPGKKGEHVTWTGGVTTHPEFACKITPRHERLNTERLLELMESV